MQFTGLRFTPPPPVFPPTPGNQPFQPKSTCQNLSVLSLPATYFLPDSSLILPEIREKQGAGVSLSTTCQLVVYI